MLRKDEKKLFICDTICMILSVMGIFAFTAMFIVVITDMKWAFIACDIYAAYTFASSCKGMEDYLKSVKIKKNAKAKINLTARENFSIL